MPPRPDPTPVKLSAKLPKGLPLNGLGTVHEQLVKFGTATVIMTVSASEVLNRIGGSKQPIVTIEHIEGLTGDLAEEGRILLHAARQNRESDAGVLPGMGTGDITD